MKMNVQKMRWIFAALCVLLLLCIVPVNIRAAQEDETEDSGKITDVTFDDLAGKKVGVMTGTPQDEFVKAKVKDPDLMYFNSFTDLALALQENKIDYYVNSTISYRIMQESYPEFGYIDQVFISFDMGTIFPKTSEGSRLQEQMNEYLKKIKADGTLEKWQDYWLNPNDWEKVSIPKSGKNGTLEMAAITTTKPFCFVVDEGYGGLDTAVAAGFCEAYGYGLKVDNVEFAGALSGVSSGKYDLAGGQISYTEERAESVLYSDFYCSQEIVPIVRKQDYASASSEDTERESFVESLKKSFHKTFIQEHRYKMILSGLGITLIITAFGFLLANIFGALFCAMAMSGNKLLKLLSDVYSRVMQGTPIVVILMILFYIIFTGRDISGVTVASIGFGITSGAYLAQLFEGSIAGVDRGQREAALAIGFTPFQTFTGIVLPQAIRSMLPGYFSQLISLMKGTAVVGYIAVADLTKSGDIIRSTTFDPFFPLIAIALIYFVIACILLSVLKQIQKKLAPKRITSAKGGEK